MYGLPINQEPSSPLHQSGGASRTCPDEGNAKQAVEPASSTEIKRSGCYHVIYTKVNNNTKQTMFKDY